MEGVESIFTIGANHMDMCRYPNKNDDGYRKVSGELQRLCERVRKTEQIMHEEGEAIENDRSPHCKLLRETLSKLEIY